LLDICCKQRTQEDVHYLCYYNESQTDGINTLRNNIEKAYNLKVYDLVVDRNSNAKIYPKNVCTGKEAIVIATGMKTDRHAASVIFFPDTANIIVVKTKDLTISNLMCSNEDYMKALQTGDSVILQRNKRKADNEEEKEVKKHRDDQFENLKIKLDQLTDMVLDLKKQNTASATEIRKQDLPAPPAFTPDLTNAIAALVSCIALKK